MTTIGEILSESRDRYFHLLSAITIEAIIAFRIGKDRVFLHTHPEYSMTKQIIDLVFEDLDSAGRGKPLSYITGVKEFCGLSFFVNESVLIPRPESEDIVWLINDWVKKNRLNSPAILDMGTGSGAIALSLATFLPAATLTAADISPEALRVAQKNAISLGVENRLSFVSSDLFSDVKRKYDVIAANLPYIDNTELDGLEVKNWEPRLALDGGKDGIELIAVFLNSAGNYLLRPGLIILEIGARQKTQVELLARKAFPISSITVLPDLAGFDRIVKIVVE